MQQVLAPQWPRCQGPVASSASCWSSTQSHIGTRHCSVVLPLLDDGTGVVSLYCRFKLNIAMGQYVDAARDAMEMARLEQVWGWQSVEWCWYKDRRAVIQGLWVAKCGRCEAVATPTVRWQGGRQYAAFNAEMEMAWLQQVVGAVRNSLLEEIRDAPKPRHDWGALSPFEPSLRAGTFGGLLPLHSRLR